MTASFPSLLYLLSERLGGDGIDFAEQLALETKSEVKRHRDFHTAVVTLKGGDWEGWKIDVATARLEYYPVPVALPTVELSCLKMDLYRRDFSINAGAIQLNASKYGHLVDFFQIENDIKSKHIRVLHSLSFVEDPTRLYRAVRFEQRYGFQIDKQTSRLMQGAIRHGFVHRLSGFRLLHEIQKIMEEKKPHKCINRLHKPFELFNPIHPRLQELYSPKPVQQALASMDLYAMLGLQQRYSRWKLLFLALCSVIKFVTSSYYSFLLPFMPNLLMVETGTEILEKF